VKIRRAFKLRLSPTTEQEQSLKQHAGNTRFLYNYLLEQNIEKYDKEQKFIFGHEMITSLPKLKEEHEFLGLSFSQSLQQVGRHLDKALRDFLDESQPEKKFPAFKKKRNNRDSFTVPQKFRVAKNYVFIPKIGEIPWIKHRAIKGKIKHLTVKQDGSQWYCSVNVELKVKEPKPIIKPENIISADLGIKTFAMLTDGEPIDLEKVTKKEDKKLKKFHRHLSRKKEGSNNRKKHLRRLQVLHRKIRNKRKDFQHQESRDMINKYDGIILESLNISGMMKNHCLSKAVQNCAWYQFISFLKYKSQWAGKPFIQIDRWAATSKKCCRCGWYHKELKLKDRTFICQECQLEIDRDLNAAINIYKIGIIQYLKLEIPWDSRESFDLYVSLKGDKLVKQTPGERGSYSASAQCPSLNQEKETLGFSTSVVGVLN
jgi:putative transposase